MNKKKLSHSGLQSSVTSVMAALLCIVIGMAVGFLVLLAINPAHAWGDGFVRIIKGGFHDAPYGVGKELANAAPLVMTGLSVGFAFKTGLFNIGASGQYTLGAFGALYCAIMLKLPWFVCLLVATILGGIWGAIPGFFKAYFNINEVITSIMFNWIGLYLVNELIYQNGTGPMYDVRNTRTLNLGKSAELSKALIPDFGLNKMFQTNSTTIAIFLAAAVAVLIWVILNKTTFGYELKAVGLNKSAARYAGINEKKNIILSMAIAGALAGFGAGLYYLSNVSQSRVDLNESTRSVGNLRIKPTVSASKKGRFSITTLRTVVSRVANSLFSANTSLFDIRFMMVLLPTLVYPTSATRIMRPRFLRCVVFCLSISARRSFSKLIRPKMIRRSISSWVSPGPRKPTLPFPPPEPEPPP